MAAQTSYKFQGSDKVISVKLQFFNRKCDNLAMKDIKTIKQFSCQAVEFVDYIKRFGDTIQDKILVEKF